MSARDDEGTARSVHQRLLNMARASGSDFNGLLVQFAIERALYRLSVSSHVERFVLKGALMFRVWSGDLHRPTLDVDLLGYGDPAPAAVERVFREILRDGPQDDGIEFDLDTLRVEEIRTAQEYGGVRVRCKARLGAARIPLQFDVGFGDVVVPAPSRATLPALLGHPVPALRVYSPESVVAEKLHALVVLGIATSRMKDLRDLLEIARRFEFSENDLVDAIRATFGSRKTPLPVTEPLGLTKAFGEDPGKREQWAAFRSRMAIKGDEELTEVVGTLAAFLGPALARARGRPEGLGRWTSGMQWRAD